MEPSRPVPIAPAALASLIAANLAPIAGILLLGWSPLAIIVLYFVDTLLGLGVVMLLVMVHVTGNAQGRPLRGAKDWLGALFGLAIFGAIFALPMSVPLWFLGPEEISAEIMRPDSGFGYGVAAQLVMSTLVALRMHRSLKAREDDDRVLGMRALFLVARWMTLFIAMVVGLVGLLGPVAGSFVLVAIYAGASIYFELFPERAVRFVRGARSKPLRFEADLDGPPASIPTQPVEAPVMPATNPDDEPRRRSPRKEAT